MPPSCARPSPAASDLRTSEHSASVARGESARPAPSSTEATRPLPRTRERWSRGPTVRCNGERLRRPRRGGSTSRTRRPRRTGLCRASADRGRTGRIVPHATSLCHAPGRAEPTCGGAWQPSTPPPRARARRVLFTVGLRRCPFGRGSIRTRRPRHEHGPGTFLGERARRRACRPIRRPTPAAVGASRIEPHPAADHRRSKRASRAISPRPI
jgi:hypothetical protein